MLKAAVYYRTKKLRFEQKVPEPCRVHSNVGSLLGLFYLAPAIIVRASICISARFLSLGILESLNSSPRLDRLFLLLIIKKILSNIRHLHCTNGNEDPLKKK